MNGSRLGPLCFAVGSAWVLGFAPPSNANGPAEVSEVALSERQLTSAPYNHILTNANVWSPDGKWVYYDVRSALDGSEFDGTRIERVHTETGEVQVVYRSRNGACCGVVTASPVDDRVIFILGPEHPTDDWAYSAWHRRGAMLRAGLPDTLATLDARNIVSPFTPGALRGGTHVHVFSGDGKWVSFTYEDHVLATSDNPAAAKNQRNIGVAAPYGEVHVPSTHPRNHDGKAFCALVTQTWDAPRPGSDQISRAYSDAWVGNAGYVKEDGSRQQRALAFLGDVVARDGRTVSELFLVDIPEDITQPGAGPLSGTERTRPAPPHGAHQRRLTNTVDRPYPGLGPTRHWPRSSPDGSEIALSMPDEKGRGQLWTISPTGKGLRQLTRAEQGIASAFTWRADGKAIACVSNGRVCEVDSHSGRVLPLSAPTHGPSVRPEAVVYSPDGATIAYVRPVSTSGTLLNQIFVVPSEINR